MRIEFYINPSGKIIPKNNRIMITSLIKKAIENADIELFKEIYFFNNKANKKIKDFTFARYLENFKIKKDYIEVGRVKVTVTTTNYNLGIAICNGIISIKNFNYKGYNLEISSARLLKEKLINENEVVFRTLSGIHIKDKNNRAIDINDKDFENELNYISDLYLKSYRGYGLKEKLNFIPISMKKVVVQEEIRGFKDVTSKEVIFINSYIGIFKLIGAVEDLNILLQSGIGFRRSQGYGAIEIL